MHNQLFIMFLMPSFNMKYRNPADYLIHSPHLLFNFEIAGEAIFCASSSVFYVLAATYANLIKAIAYLTSQTIYCGFL